jgi:flagellar motor protein MotB
VTDPYRTNPWPPFVDAVVLVFAAFVLVMLVAIAKERGLIADLSAQRAELAKVREDKKRIEKRLSALAAPAAMDIEDGRVILQGEVLFDSGSAELTPAGKAFIERLVGPMRELLAIEPDQMVMVAGHTDDMPVRPNNGKYASNWELSTARATSVARALTGVGLPETRVFAAGFGHNHPRVVNSSDDSRQKNRRIEVLLVPIHAVTEKALTAQAETMR